MAKKIVKRKVAKPVAKKAELQKAKLPLGLTVVIALLVIAAAINIGLSFAFGIYSLIAYGIIAMQLIGAYYLYKTRKVGLIIILAIQIYGIYSGFETVYAFFTNIIPAELHWVVYLSIIFLPIDLWILGYLIYKRKLFK